jgi:hypothetical protein
MKPWWDGFSPAEVTVTCGGEQHRLRWDAGRLKTLDHDDPDGERTLAALGGESCTCVDVLDAWERHQDDLRVLVLARRGPGDELAASADQGIHQLAIAQPQALAGPPALSRPGRASVTSIRLTGPSTGGPAYASLGGAPPSRTPEDELIELLGLGGGLQERLVAGVAAAWRARLDRRDRRLARARPQLHAALHGRVFAAMRSWLGGTDMEIELNMIGEDAQPTAVTDDGVIAVELPFGWLVDVWAKGLATVFGRFCLAAETSDGRSWTLTTIGADFGPPSLMSLQLS